MPKKHISELPEEYHERLHFVEGVTERAANYMFEHNVKEDPGDIFDPPLWEMRDALAKLIGLPDDYYEYATWEIMLGTC